MVGVSVSQSLLVRCPTHRQGLTPASPKRFDYTDTWHHMACKECCLPLVSSNMAGKSFRSGVLMGEWSFWMMILDWSKRLIGHRWARSHSAVILSQLSALINCASGDIPSKLTLRSVRCSWRIPLTAGHFDAETTEAEIPMEFGGYKIPKGAFSSGRNQWGIAEPPGGYRPGASPEATIFLYADAVHKETIGDRLRHSK